MEERIGWQEQNKSQIEGEEKRSGRFVGAAETSKEHAEWRRFQQRNLNILGLMKKSGLSATEREQLASMPDPPLPKGTKPFVQSTRS